jgi:hypothetical protein
LKKKTKKAVKSCLENNTILSQTAVLDIARSRVEEFLPLQAAGYACTTEQLLDGLLAVSCQKETIEQVCSDLKIKVGAESIRGYFNDQLKVENLYGLQEAVNLVLQKSFSLELKGQKLEIAIDFHDQSYYGKLEQSSGLWVGAEAKNGTTKVYRVATVYVIKNGHRLTLGIKFVVPDETTKEIVEYLLNQLNRIEIEAHYLYLDRGFASIEVARYLKGIKQKAIIASPIRGKTGGLRALCVGKKSYRTKHVFRGRETRDGRIGNGNVQVVYKFDEERQESAKSEMAGVYLDLGGSEYECQKSERKLSQKIWN